MKRINELKEEIEKIEKSKYLDKEFHEFELLDKTLYLPWKVQVLDIFNKLLSQDSTYYEEFIELDKMMYNDVYWNGFQNIKSIFIAFKSDYEKGYLSSIETLIQAEVFGTQLEQSQELLDSGYKLASAVIAGIVLETGLREICIREEISQGKLDKMNADLAKKGIYNKLRQKRITALADIRNSAAHGKEDEFTKDDVVNMIHEVEQFLANTLDNV